MLENFFLISYQRRKVIQNYHILVFKFLFFSSYQHRKVLQNYLFLISYQRCKVLENYLFLVSYQRRKLLENYLFGFLSAPQSAAELNYFRFLINVKKLLSFTVFDFLSAPENASKLLSFSFLSTLLSCLSSPVAYHRRKVLEIFFCFLSTPKSYSELPYFGLHCKFLFFSSYQHRKVLQNYFFLISYQRRKVLQNYFFLVFLPTPQSAGELLFWFLISASKCCRIELFSFSFYQRC